jgi:CRP-like cAMP-binding protein
MSSRTTATVTKNKLLESLSASDMALMQPHLEIVSLDLRMDLERPDKVIKGVYFMEQGIASVVSSGDRGTQVEVGLIGSEGVSGIAVILGSDRSPHHTFIQAAGDGLRVEIKMFEKLISRSATLHRHLLRYVQTFAVQIACTAAANGRGKVEQRLARWILMAHDRLDSDNIRLTHEFLAIMLGIRRAGVTDALSALVRRRAIRKEGLGLFVVVNRKVLEKIAGSFYGVPEREYKRLMT